MTVFLTYAQRYRKVAFKSEAELESAVVAHSREIFGDSRIYVDVKKAIGAKGRTRNIPDGYLIDLSGRTPRLFVVENELAQHDVLRHIAVQILQFSLAFEAEKRLVKKILLDALQAAPEMERVCKQYIALQSLRGLDQLLELLVEDSPFSALVIIDEIPEDLESVLMKKFQFPVELLQISRFENSEGQVAHAFEPFLAELSEVNTTPTSSTSNERVSPQGTTDIDTIVVPAREDGFVETFLGEDRWWSVRIHSTMRPQIKYLAVYRIAPLSAITHIAPVKNIEPWKDSGKYVINFTEHPTEITPIPLLKNGKVKALQNLRYTSRERLLSAKSLDDIWS